MKKILLIIFILIVIFLGINWYFGWKDIKECNISQNSEGYLYKGHIFATHDAAVRACVPYAN